MIEKENNRGSIYAAAGMALMAHKFGVSSRIEVTDKIIPDDAFEYETIFRDPPTCNWTLNPNDRNEVDENRRAILFRFAVTCGASIGNAYDPDFNEDEDTLWDDYIHNQQDNCQKMIQDFLTWYGKDDCAAEDLANYLEDIFDAVARQGDTRLLVDNIVQLTMLKGGIISGPEIREIVNPSIPFGLLEYDAPAFYPTWHDALNSVTYSCR